MAHQAGFVAVVAALIAAAFVVTEAARTCEPEIVIPALIGGDYTGGFDVCLFDETGNAVTDKIAFAGNSLWYVQAQLYLGNCYCNQDCSPSQIVCEDPIDLGIGNITNGIAKIVYNAEAYQFYCYCPEYIAPGADPCKTPPIPSQCNPVG